MIEQPIFLIAEERARHWCDLLARAGLAARVVTGDTLVMTEPGEGPGIVLIDLCVVGRDRFARLIESLAWDDGGHRRRIVALLPSNEGRAPDDALEDAYALGADDFLLEHMAPQTLAHRLRFIARSVRREVAQAVRPGEPLVAPALGRHGGEWRHLRDRFADLLADGEDEAARRPVAIVVVNIDRFNRIVASLGRPHRDQLLADIAKRLKMATATLGLDGVVTMVRLEGDEFAFLIPGIDQIQQAYRSARTLLKSLEPAFAPAGREVYLTACAGIALAPAAGRDADAVLACAHAALMEAKRVGTNSVQLYSPGLVASVREQFELETRLRRAMQTDELELAYQPQVDIHTGQVTGVEALVRWHHPELGPVSPERFIEIAHQAGLMGELGEWVLRNSVNEAASWTCASLASLKLSVNISPDMFKQRDVAALTLARLADSGFPAERLSLEITETLLLNDPDTARDAIARLRQAGVRLALDDFGTGYSSLSYVKALAFDDLKIDRSFVADMDRSEEGLAMVRAIIGMARTLGMTVIAEGVERRAQLERLAAEGCTIYQGFLCAEPMSGSALVDWVARGCAECASTVTPVSA